MKLLIRTLIGLVLALGLVIVVSVFLPSEYRISREIVVAAPPAKVFPHLNNLRRWPAWTAWSERDPEMRFSYSGPEQGVGAAQRWDSDTQGGGSLKITQSDADRYIAYDLNIDGFDSLSLGELELHETGGSTRVVWIDNVDLGSNPVAKYFGLMLDGMIGADFEAGLDNLKRMVESSQ